MNKFKINKALNNLKHKLKKLNFNNICLINKKKNF